MDTCQLRAATRNVKLLEGRNSRPQPLVWAPAVCAPACKTPPPISNLAAIGLRVWKAGRGGVATTAESFGQPVGTHLICQLAKKWRFGARCQADDQVEGSGGLDSEELMDSLRKAKDRQRMAVIFEMEGYVTSQPHVRC